MANDAKQTVVKEFKPSALLQKYEYYKDMSATLDRRLADIHVYESELSDIKSEYKGVKEMPKDEREYYNLKKSEMIGLINSFNQISAEYNSAMSKFNYAFCNRGQLPQGATIELPREYKTYIYSIKN